MSGPDAIVVGSGPNGLAAALTLAAAGRSVVVYEARDEIGGGMRSAELTVPGLVHDVCSAVHAFGVASPFLASLPLADHGLVWRWPEIELAHPLGGDRAVALWRSEDGLDRTARSLGPDAGRWHKIFSPLVRNFEDLAPELLGPVIHVPRHPITLARFGLRGLLPASRVWRGFAGEEAAALFAGCAAHAFHPLDRAGTAAMGLVLAASGHAVGWPVAEGGSAAIGEAMASLLRSLGGEIHTGHPVTDLSRLPPAPVVLLDTAPGAAVELAGGRVPPRVRRALQRFRHGPAAFKVDLAVEGGVPWSAQECRRAGTVHVGGSAGEIAAAEADIAVGRMPGRPFVLVGQQYLADPGRSVGDVHPVWAYAHVPHAHPGDATDAVLAQIERFAPGLRDRVVGMAVTGPLELAAHNPNFVGGDIATGSNSLRQLVFRPRPAVDPYRIGDGLYLCSAATPPGGGVHGMCGHHAARRALADLGGPSDAQASGS